jgi:hypothetical protein
MSGKPLFRVVALLALAFAPGCMAPPPPAERVTDAARELNTAARFGRLDIAVGRTAEGARAEFLNRRSRWGEAIRVLDVELVGLEMQDGQHALVMVDVAWVRSDESTLRSTRLAQVWKDEEDGWRLAREQRSSGDLGLFGEVVVRPPSTHRDAHFPVTTIRE